MGVRAVVAGASGFVGANLARRLLRDGHEVHLMLRPGFETWRLEDVLSDVRVHSVNLQDRAGVADAIQGIKPDWIFQLAVHGAYSSQTDVYEIMQTNLFGTVNLVEACLRTGFEAFVNSGSSSEYGLKDHAPSEREWLEPNSHYAVSKAAATHYCRFTAQSRGVHLPTLRLYSVFGPYEEPTRLMPTLALYGLRGELPPLVDPRIARDFVYVDDVVDAYVRAAMIKEQEAGAVYNVGTGVQTTLADAVECTRRVLGLTVAPAWGSMPERQWDTTSWVADNRLIQQALAWAPRYDFARGFRSMVEWFREEPGRAAFYSGRRGG
jgi:nucleoside-diphosphate-sugar epimerase